MKSAVTMLLVLVLLTAPFVIAVKPVYASSKMWTQTYGGSDNDFALSLVATSDGGYVIAGTIGKTFDNLLSGDYWLLKLDSDGNEQWNQTYDGTGKDSGCFVVQTTDGGYVISGYSTSTSLPDISDFWLVKTDSAGNVEWNRTYGGPENDVGLSAIQTSDGGYLMVGHTASYGDELTDMWLVKTDSAGNVEWNQTYGESEFDAGRSVVESSCGGYTILGVTGSFFAGDVDFWLVKTDAEGALLWNRTYGGLENDFALSFVQTSDGGYAMIGNTLSYGAGSFDFWLVKTDSAGNVEWNQTYGGTESDTGYFVVETSDGGYALAGETASHGAGDSDFWLIKTDADGNELWNQTYGGTDSDGAYSLVKASDGGYALAGSTYSFGAGGQDVYVVKTDEYGVVPEAAWVVLPLLLTATLAIFITKKKILHPRTRAS